MIPPPTVAPLYPWGRRLGSTAIAETCRGLMIPPPTVAPLWGSEIQPEPRSWRETSGEHWNRRNTSRAYDCPAYCCPSLGLGNTAADVDVNVVDVVDVVDSCVYLCSVLVSVVYIVV